MAFYLDFDYSKGVWFDYPAQPDLKLKLRYLIPSMAVSIREESKNDDGKIDISSFGKNVLKWVIEEWDGFFSGQDKNCTMAEINAENIDKISELDPALVQWILSIVTKRINFGYQDEEVKLEKNLKSSSVSK